jgi:hypothetical protein
MVSGTTETVNGNRVKVSATNKKDYKKVKNFARELSQNDNRIDRINGSSVCHVVVWMKDDDTLFNPPEGYYIESVFLSSSGAVGMDIEKSDE